MISNLRVKAKTNKPTQRRRGIERICKLKKQRVLHEDSLENRYFKIQTAEFSCYSHQFLTKFISLLKCSSFFFSQFRNKGPYLKQYDIIYTKLVHIRQKLITKTKRCEFSCRKTQANGLQKSPKSRQCSIQKGISHNQAISSYPQTRIALRIQESNSLHPLNKSLQIRTLKPYITRRLQQNQNLTDAFLTDD